MREKFREALDQYREIAVAQDAVEKLEQGDISADDLDESPASLSKTIAGLDGQLQRRARQSATNLEVQREIFDIQKRKQAIMTELHRDLARLDDPEAKHDVGPADARPVQIKKGEMCCRSRGSGELMTVTAGEILSDGVWGIDYHLSKAVPKHLRKKYLVDRSRRDIERLLDEQIFTEELANERGSKELKGAYANLRESREQGDPRLGAQAEKLLNQLVAKRIIDENAPYRQETADVFADVAMGIDSIIHNLQHVRGLVIDKDGDAPDAKGLQITINDAPDNLKRKRDKIARSKQHLTATDGVDDIALGVFNMEQMRHAMNEWESAGRPPGGPDRFLEQDIRDEMFHEVVKGME